MYLNIPDKITNKDINFIGKIFKQESSSFIISDLENEILKNTFKLTGYGFYNYIYNICDKYLFIIGNQVKNTDIKPNKIDFISKILKFEYLLNNKDKSINKIDIPSNILTIITPEKWQDKNFLGLMGFEIENIIQYTKTYLKNYENNYIKYFKYLCDNNESYGFFENGFCMDLLTSNYIYILKDTEFDGYIIKYNHEKF